MRASATNQIQGITREDVVANNMRGAINIAWEKGGPNFQVRFDKSSGQAQEMNEGALRVF